MIEDGVEYFNVSILFNLLTFLSNDKQRYLLIYLVNINGNDNDKLAQKAVI